MIRLLLGIIAWFFLLASRVQALSAIPGSPCYNSCNGNNATTASDIVCTDNDFTNSTKGQLLEKCLSCLNDSSYQAGFMTDSILFLYYLSTVQQTCLTGSQTSACSSRCSSISEAFSDIGGRAFFTDTYSYCSANDNAYTSQAADCTMCLQSQAGTVVLGNFVSIGNSACSLQPNLLDGQSVNFSGDLFAVTYSSSTSMHSSTPTISASSSASSATAAATHSSAASSTALPLTSNSTKTASSTTPASSGTNSGDSHNQQGSNSSGSTSKGLSRGAAAGIGVVAGLIGVAAIVGLAVFLRRRQKSDAFERMPDNPEPQRSTQSDMTISNKAAALGATSSGSAAVAPVALGMPEDPSVADAIRKEVSMAAGIGGLAGAQAATKSLKSAKSSKSSKSILSSRSALTPRTSEWYYAANPKQSSDLSPLPQKGWD